MQREIFITEQQFEKFKKLETINKVSTNLRKMIDDESSPISGLYSKLVRKGLEILLIDGYEYAVSDFNDDITAFSEKEITNKLSKLIAIVKKKEQPIKRQLEGLCENILNEFDNDVKINCNLVLEIPKTKTFHITSNVEESSEYESIDRFNSIEEEIQKRKIMNTLTMGCALDLYQSEFEKHIQELFSLDEDLPHLYSKIMKINNYLTFISNKEITDDNNYQSGYVKVDISKKCINSFGTIFPFLLIESFRGLLELVSSKYFLKDKASCREIFSKSDVLKDEPYYMTVGASLWEKIYKIDDKKYVLPFFETLINYDTHTFISLFNEIVANTRFGKDEIKKILEGVINKTDYIDFENELQKRENKYRLILNSELTEKELL